jgi:3'(2'), 5'-bisphosphate nucleotidase
MHSDIGSMADFPDPFLTALSDVALSAGREIMRIYSSGEHQIQTKADCSPVTTADLAAERVILQGLAQLEPAVPVIAEEQAAAGNLPMANDDFYLVDPLDGTREFISRNGEFTVNIARIVRGQPVAGVVFAPALGRLYAGGEQTSWTANVESGSLREWQPIHVRLLPQTNPVIVASRSHRDPKTDDFVSRHMGAKLISIGSSLKFCLVASGEADLYPRFGRTMEWDTAAGHAVLLAAGGKVLDEHGAPLIYGKRERGFDNPAFIASA